MDTQTALEIIRTISREFDDPGYLSAEDVRLLLAAAEALADQFEKERCERNKAT